MRYAAILQTNWDWRAAANFMLGGGGGALLLAAAMAGSESSTHLSATLLGMALMGTGLTMVWLEIGRPWRAANVMFKPQNSWMTREAYVAGCAFLLAAGSLLFRLTWLPMAAGLAGIAFLYCQARILRAAKGVPAWREPSIVMLIVTTGLVEGIAYLLLVQVVFAEPAGKFLMLLAGFLMLRLLVWFIYRGHLLASDPPSQVKAALSRLGSRFVLFGHFLPVLFIAGSYMNSPFSLINTSIATIIVVLSGWDLKFVLVTRLAHVQGFGLGKLQRGHPLQLAGHQKVSEASVRLRKTRERELRNQRRNQ
ncbi:MAG: phenylacetyl-CoA:acceptor oxidoreductase [Zoogloeaceae bacterium]|nr:phenylacetyl-CoA:acceptor oxidoreductase [Zoogloeaceae bacterium]